MPHTKHEAGGPQRALAQCLGLASSQVFWHCIIILASHSESPELLFLQNYLTSEFHLPAFLPGPADWLAQMVTPCLCQNTAMLHLPGKIFQNLLLDSQMSTANLDHSLTPNAILFGSCVLPAPSSAPTQLLFQLHKWALTNWAQHVLQDEQTGWISLYKLFLPHSSNPFKSLHNSS